MKCFDKYEHLVPEGDKDMSLLVDFNFYAHKEMHFHYATQITPT